MDEELLLTNAPQDIGDNENDEDEDSDSESQTGIVLTNYFKLHLLLQTMKT